VHWPGCTRGRLAEYEQPAVLLPDFQQIKYSLLHEKVLYTARDSLPCQDSGVIFRISDVFDGLQHQIIEGLLVKKHE
jgi:hypothetical protein